MIEPEADDNTSSESRTVEQEIADLVERGGRQEPGAFAELCQRYQRRLERYVETHMSAKGLARTGAEDVVQDALITIAQKLESLEYRGVEAFEAWMLQICEGKIRDWIRHISAAKRDIGRESTLSEDDSLIGIAKGPRPAPGITTPSKIAYIGEKGRIVGDILDKLSERHGAVLRLRLLNGLSFAEIGEVMEISEDAAKALYGRAALRFRDVAGRHPGVSDFTEVLEP